MDFRKESVRIANNEAYLDRLFMVYPTVPDMPRSIPQNLWNRITTLYDGGLNEDLVRTCLELDLFPIKDSYVAYLRRDPQAINRNKQTVNRLAGQIRQLSLPKIKEICTQPAEANRQMGQRFKEWLGRGALGVYPVSLSDFVSSSENAVLGGSDEELQTFATEYLGYQHDKGLDFVARFNGKYVIGEAKFLTDFGGHQNAQLNDALSTLNATVNPGVIKVAILDGVVYIPNTGKMFRLIHQETGYIMSALLLHSFLYQL